MDLLEKDLAELVALLRAPDPESRTRAGWRVQALWKRFLKPGEKPNERWMGSHDVHLYGDVMRVVAPALLEALKDAVAGVREAALAALETAAAIMETDLGEHTHPIVTRLVGLLSTPDRKTQLGALRILGKFAVGNCPQTIAAEESALRLLSDKDSPYDVRAEAARTLGKIGASSVEAARALADALDDQNEAVQREAVEALSRCGSSRSPLSVFLEKLHDPSAKVKERVVRALPRVDPDGVETIPALTGALEDADRAVRCAALDALGELGPRASPAVKAIHCALHDTDERVRWHAVQAIQKVVEDRSAARESLRPIVKDPSTGVRVAAAMALGNQAQKGDGTEALFLDLLKDPFEDVRKFGYMGLANLELTGEPYFSCFLEALRHSSFRIRLHGIQGLEAMGPAAKEAVPALLEALAIEKGYPRFLIAQALARIDFHHPRLEPILCELFEDPDEGTRLAAAEILFDLRPGLRGLAQPIENWMTIKGGSHRPCNYTTASLTLRFTYGKEPC